MDPPEVILPLVEGDPQVYSPPPLLLSKQLGPPGGCMAVVCDNEQRVGDVRAQHMNVTCWGDPVESLLCQDAPFDVLMVSEMHVVDARLIQKRLATAGWSSIVHGAVRSGVPMVDPVVEGAPR